MVYSNLFVEMYYRMLFITLGCFYVYIVCYIYKQTLMYLLIKPIFFDKNIYYFIFTSITDVLYVYWSILTFFTFHFFFFFFFFNLYCFMLPGLYKKEIYIINKSCFFCLGFFIILIRIFYMFLIPYIWNIFSYLNYISSSYLVQRGGVKYTISFMFFEAKLVDYLSVFFDIYILCCFFYIFFLISGLTLKYFFDIKIIELKKNRKFIYFLIIFLATVITPPDIFSQLFFSLFMIIIFETFIIALFIINKCY